MRNRIIFCNEILSNGDVIVLHELTGLDYFNACLKAGQDVNIVPFLLVQECCTLNGSKVTLKYIQDLNIYDVQKLLDVVAAQMNRV